MAKRRSSRTKSRDSRQRGLGLLFWLCLVVIIVAVGFAAREPIKAAFAQVTGGHQKAAPANAPAPQVTVTRIPASERPSRPPASATPRPADNAKPATVDKTPLQTQAPAQPERPTARKARLFFTSVDSNGKISMKSVIRSIPASDSPLHDTLDSLLKGPTGQELNLGMLSMIPTEAKLRGVTVKDDTAYLDFSESFRFNPSGMDAMSAQLQQVVYAATEFPSVKKVQILIEGKTVRYLGPEGIRIDRPLTRDSFQN
jgi:spore germination protein GerM